MPVRKFAIFLSLPLLSNAILSTSSWAKTHEPEHLLTLKGDHISTILGASREPHTMTSLARLGAPAEYVNDDLEKLTFNKGPCIYVAVISTLPPPAAYGVDVECFDLVAERESKSFAYATDSAGKVVSSGTLSAVGEYGKEDPLFDLAGWERVSDHVSPKLKQKIADERAQGRAGLPANIYKVNATGQNGGPRVTAPILTHSEDAEFSDSGVRANISGLAIVSIVIDIDGLPRHIRSILPLGYGMDEQAVKAVEQYRFQPSKLQGKPVPVQVSIEVRFNR
jgi:TonB family protein